MTTFSDLALNPLVLQAVRDAGYERPTPIQVSAIPPALAGRDVLGIAQTGTGKTASFTLPLITRLLHGRARARMPRSLILTPTRELAAQVAESFDTYAKYTKLTKALLIGGVSFAEQDRAIDRGVDVLIATPGRLLDHFDRGKLLLTGVEILVVDEADRMLDMGFIPDIERIFKLTPPSRQTLFFSATMPPEIERLTSQFLAGAVKVEVARQATTAETIDHALVLVTPSRKDRAAAEKRSVLRALIDAEGEACTNAIIFCNRKMDVDVLARSLKKHGFNAAAIHGDLDQSVRMQTLDAFRAGRLRFLVASDVAARGLDIPQVSHVFNFDVPTHAEDYVHRIGRTGRAGREGRAFTLATPADQKYVEAIEKLIRQSLKRAPLPAGHIPEAKVAREKAEASSAAEQAKPAARAKSARTEKKAAAESRPNARASGEASLRAQKADQAAGPRPSAEKGHGLAEKEHRAAVESAATKREPFLRPVAAHDAPPKADPQARRAHPLRNTPRLGSVNAQGAQAKAGPGSKEEGPIIGMGAHVPEFLLRRFGGS